jgi:hypothetical protein
MNISIETAAAITVDTLKHDLAILEDMLKELNSHKTRLPECKRIDRKHFKRDIKAIKIVLEYYTTEAFP